MEIGRVMIVGMGLIGGSLAMALRDADLGTRIFAVDADPATVERAVASGIADEGCTVDNELVDEALASGEVDLVVLAMPAGFADGMFRRIEESGYRGVITDTASTKGRICEAARAILTDGSAFIPGHPMSGSEVSGLDGATKDLFGGKYWILCPDEHTNGEMFLALHALVTSLGAKCISIDRDEHDAMVAVISHVPHMTASALMELASRRAAGRDELIRLAAGGFRDSTRIAAGSPSLWTGIALDNAGPIADALGELIGILQGVESMIADRDPEGIEGFLARASSARRSIPARWLPASEKLTIMMVSMENHVGVVAEVTAAAGKCGCNIQSIGIEHITDETAVLEMILTDEGDIPELTKQLRSQGYKLVAHSYDGQ